MPRGGDRRGEDRRPRCPRCGRPYSYLSRERRGDRRYVYAVHVEDGRVVKKCYLGPEEGYVAGSVANELLPLSGLVDDGRYGRYLIVLLEAYVDGRIGVEREDARKLGVLLKKALEKAEQAGGG